MNAHAPTMILAALLAACSPPAPPPPPPPLAGTPIGGPFTLTDQDGRRTSDRSFAGRWRIVYFGYTFCPDVCPTDVQNIATGLRQVERERPALGARIVPIFVTIDPARDTPTVLKAFVGAFHPRMVGLTGSAAEIDAAADAYRVTHRRGPGTAGGYLMDHSRQAYLMDPAGRPVALLPAEQDGAAVAAEIERWAS